MASSSFTAHDIADDIIARDSDSDLSEISESEYDYEDDIQSDVGANVMWVPMALFRAAVIVTMRQTGCWMMIWTIIYQSGARHIPKLQGHCFLLCW